MKVAILNGKPMVLVQPTNLLESRGCQDTVESTRSSSPIRRASGFGHVLVGKPSISVKVKVLSLPLSHSIKVNGGNKNVKVVQYLLQE